jgi:hypothetical protein
MRISLAIQMVIRPVAILLVALVLGACSVSKIGDMFSAPPKLNLDVNPSSPTAAASTVVPNTQRIPVTTADFVSADGGCTPVPDSASAQTTGVSLGMPECGLVQLLGPPEKLDIGADERGDRLAVIFYGRGERPGRYSFTAGQLTSIERVAEPPPPPKAKPAKPPAKKPARA